MNKLYSAKKYGLSVSAISGCMKNNNLTIEEADEFLSKKHRAKDIKPELNEYDCSRLEILLNSDFKKIGEVPSFVRFAPMTMYSHMRRFRKPESDVVKYYIDKAIVIELARLSQKGVSSVKNIMQKNGIETLRDAYEYFKKKSEEPINYR